MNLREINLSTVALTTSFPKVCKVWQVISYPSLMRKDGYSILLVMYEDIIAYLSHMQMLYVCAFQELIFPVLTVLFLVLLAWVVSLARVKTTTSDRAVLKVNRTFPAHGMCWNCTVYVLCSPNTPEIRTLLDRTLAYLESPRPDVSYYHSSSEAEEAYLNITTSVHNASSRVIGIDFTESAGSSSVRYSLRFRARDVADTEVFFNHARE